MLQALQTLDKVISEKLEDLSEITATPTSQLKFVTDAWSQVVDCRRMLKWTYAFGYYRFADDSVTNKPQQEFFEFNQVGMLRMHVMLSQQCLNCMQCIAQILALPQLRHSVKGRFMRCFNLICNSI